MSKTSPQEGASLDSDRNTQSFEGAKTPVSASLQQDIVINPETEEVETQHSQSTAELSKTDDREVKQPSFSRQVIAVSASKGPATFFNLARKFLATDETCDLSALEGAIVSAVDTANLLERSKIARVISIETSYVTVESKRKQHGTPTPVKQLRTATQDASSGTIAYSAATTPASAVSSTISREATGANTQKRKSPDIILQDPTDKGTHAQQTQPTLTTHKKKGRKDVKRSRITITVERTSDYADWLLENPMHEHDGDDDVAAAIPSERSESRR